MKNELTEVEIEIIGKIKSLKIKFRNGGLSHDEYDELENLCEDLKEESNNYLEIDP